MFDATVSINIFYIAADAVTLRFDAFPLIHRCFIFTLLYFRIRYHYHHAA